MKKMGRSTTMRFAVIVFIFSKIVYAREINDCNWITQLLSFMKPIPKNISPKCFNDTSQYLAGVKNLSAWALSMMDSSGRFPSNTLLENIHALGNFDQCLAATYSHESEGFTGKYCLFEMEFAKIINDDKRSESLNTFVEMTKCDRLKFENRYNSINGTRILSYLRRKWALCMPSSCTVDDMRIIGKIIIDRATYLSSDPNVSIFLKENQCCDRNHKRPYEIIDFVSISIFIVLGFTILIATVHSIIVNQEKIIGWGLRLMNCFSLSNSWRDMKKEPNEAITCIMGIRSLSTVWVVMTHQFVLMPRIPFINKVDTPKISSNYFYYPMWNSYLDVDTFLLVSGLLRAQSLMKDFSVSRSILHSMIRRYLRLTPTYMIVIFFFASIFDRLDTGPFWNYYVGRNAETCRKYWWHNLFYIDNYVSDNENCALQTWYLSAEMQLFFAAPIVIYPIWKWGSTGTLIWFIVLILSVIAPFLTTMIYKLPETYISTIEIEYTHRMYMATHNRMLPYIIGLYLGTIIYRVKSVNLPNWILALGWSSSLAVMYGCFYSAMGITSVNHTTTNYDQWESVLYGGLHRFAWAVSVSWIVYACHMGYAGPIDKFLSCKLFGYLGRLSFCVYLSHMGVILYNYGVLQVPKQLHIFLTIRNFMGDFVWMLIVSLLLYLCVEAPFYNFIKNIYG